MPFELNDNTLQPEPFYNKGAIEFGFMVIIQILFSTLDRTLQLNFDAETNKNWIKESNTFIKEGFAYFNDYLSPGLTKEEENE